MKAIVDCNSFYCGCEKLFRPDLSKKPVVVLSENDSYVISRSEQAKALGIKRNSPIYQAKPLIEQHGVAVFSSNNNLYGDLSERVMQTLENITGDNKVERYSDDEAFLDVSHIPQEKLFNFCAQLKETIERWTGVTVSVGVAPTKVLAKAANRFAKKNRSATKGVMIADAEEIVEGMLQQTPVKRVWGIRRKDALRLEHWGIQTAFDLRKMSEEWAYQNLGGSFGMEVIRELRGSPAIDIKEPVKRKKAVHITTVLAERPNDLEYLKETVCMLITRAAGNLRWQGCAATYMKVYAITSDYQHHYHYIPKTSSRWAVLPRGISLPHELIQHAMPLVEQLYHKGCRYLKAGVMLSGLVADPVLRRKTPGIQSPAGGFFKDPMHPRKNEIVESAMAEPEQQYGIIPVHRSPRYTTRWDELRQVL